MTTTSTFSHSGNLGDIIYSLPTVKFYGGGTYYIKMFNIPGVIRKYNSGPVFPAYEGHINDKDYDMLAPLLEVQPYITKVEKFNPEQHTISYDLDEFRRTVGPSFTANFYETYCKTFNIPFTTEDLQTPWLFVEPKKIARIAISRSPRYHSQLPATPSIWQMMLEQTKAATDAVFLGVPEEHEAFQNQFNIKIPFYKCKDFLELAQIIEGSEMWLGNQTFACGLALGLNKASCIELHNMRPRHYNECFFPRDNIQYF